MDGWITCVVESVVNGSCFVRSNVFVQRHMRIPFAPQLEVKQMQSQLTYQNHSKCRIYQIVLTNKNTEKLGIHHSLYATLFNGPTHGKYDGMDMRGLKPTDFDPFLLPALWRCTTSLWLREKPRGRRRRRTQRRTGSFLNSPANLKSLGGCKLKSVAPNLYVAFCYHRTTMKAR